jgi:hypothetical protein
MASSPPASYPRRQAAARTGLFTMDCEAAVASMAVALAYVFILSRGAAKIKVWAREAALSPINQQPASKDLR